MGDRANFGVKQRKGTVYLYGHWAGDGMMHTLAEGLAAVQAKGRLNDEIYATRILFSQIVGGEWSGELGWGISVNEIGDNEHKIPVVDFNEGTVTLYNWSWNGGMGEPIFTQSIENFVKKHTKSKVRL